MKTAYAGAKRRTIAALVAGAVLLAGCSVTVTPKNVPLIKEAEAASLSGASVIVTNAEKDAAVHGILTDKASSSGLRANRRAWSGKLVETLARELAKRGARVSSTAPLALSVSLPEITFVKTRELYQLRVKVVISSTTGWSKNYEGIAGLSASSVWSVSDEADQLAGRALAGAVKDALGDPEFLTQLGRR
jgi:uncharacterized lipoprotein YajG